VNSAQWSVLTTHHCPPTTNMIYIASDHAGFELKNTIFNHLRETGREIEDVGPFAYDKMDDYPDFVYPCAVKVAVDVANNRGIIIGWRGNGEAMVANKVKGIRAAVYYGGNKEIVRLSRDHNDANVLSLGAGFIPVEEIKEVIDQWLALPFGAGRHAPRVEKIKKIEQKLYK
jgi:ribose 5-phosphate isomerase B